jgi:hypothetical protein
MGCKVTGDDGYEMGDGGKGYDGYGMIDDADGYDYASCDKGNGYEVGDKGTASNDGNEIIGKDDGGIGQWVRIGQESGYKGTGAATRGNDGRGKNTNRVGKGEIIDKGGGGIGQWGRSCHESGYKGIGKATRGNDGHGNCKKTCRAMRRKMRMRRQQ